MYISKLVVVLLSAYNDSMVFNIAEYVLVKDFMPLLLNRAFTKGNDHLLIILPCLLFYGCISAHLTLN